MGENAPFDDRRNMYMNQSRVDEMARKKKDEESPIVVP
jgi:hypothetical protein